MKKRKRKRARERNRKRERETGATIHFFEQALMSSGKGSEGNHKHPTNKTTLKKKTERGKTNAKLQRKMEMGKHKTPRKEGEKNQVSPERRARSSVCWIMTPRTQERRVGGCAFSVFFFLDLFAWEMFRAADKSRISIWTSFFWSFSLNSSP